MAVVKEDEMGEISSELSHTPYVKLSERSHKHKNSRRVSGTAKAPKGRFATFLFVRAGNESRTELLIHRLSDTW